VIDEAIHLYRDSVVDSEADLVDRRLIVSSQLAHLRFHLSAKIHDCIYNFWMGRHAVFLSSPPIFWRRSL
jgi:hypothetical protein